MEGGEQVSGGSASPLLPAPACLDRGPGEPAAPLLLPTSLWLCTPAGEASHAVTESCPAAASPPRGGGLCPAPMTCTGLGFFILFSKDGETFRQRCSRSLPVHFEKYPASVEHLSVKGEEIPPPPPSLLFSPDCPRLVWLWLLWVCKIELYMTFYLTRNRLSHF